MSKLYSKGWVDSNGTTRYYKDEDARDAITTLNGNSSVTGSIDNKIATAIADFGGFKVVPSLVSVTDPNTHTVYLVKDTSISGSDKYNEYIYIAGTTNDFEQIGTTSLDLSNYVQKTDYATSSTGGTVKIDGINMEIANDGTVTPKKVNSHTVESDVPANAVFSTSSIPMAVANGGTGKTTEEEAAAAFGAVAYCDTAANTAAKIATMPSYKLVKGARFRLYIKTTNTASSPTLAVNSTTSKSIYVNGSAATTSNVTSGWWDVLYDGTYYQLKNTGTQTIPLAVGGTGATSASEARSNLGLGGAATASTTTSITSGGTGLPTAGTVYSYTKQVAIQSSAPSSNQGNFLWIDTSS